MTKRKALYIGLMSGTSADAIDGALVDLSADIPKVLATYNLPLSAHVKQKVFDLALSGPCELETVRFLDQYYGENFAKAAMLLCEEAEVQPSAIEAIGSHGQTVRHYPPTEKQAGYSLQVGDPNIIAERTGVTTVADFRRRDIAAGGHGAPLAPALHAALFHSPARNRFIVNAGGIANITHLPTCGAVTGFDTGPANGLMDAWCQLNMGTDFDRDGLWAKSGKVIPALLAKLLDHHYFALPFPKSTGREDFNLSWLKQQLTDFRGLQNQDIQATLLELTATSISTAITQLDYNADAEVFMCGGGAHNLALVERLNQLLSPRPLNTTTNLGIDPDWVEATAFAWLAKRTLERQTGNLISVTGAKCDVILGGVYWT